MASSSAGPSMTSPRGSGGGTLPVTSSSNRFLSSMHLARKSGAEKNRLTDKNGGGVEDKGTKVGQVESQLRRNIHSGI